MPPSKHRAHVQCRGNSDTVGKRGNIRSLGWPDASGQTHQARGQGDGEGRGNVPLYPGRALYTETHVVLECCDGARGCSVVAHPERLWHLQHAAVQAQGSAVRTRLPFKHAMKAMYNRGYAHRNADIVNVLLHRETTVRSYARHPTWRAPVLHFSGSHTKV